MVDHDSNLPRPASAQPTGSSWWFVAFAVGGQVLWWLVIRRVFLFFFTDRSWSWSEIGAALPCLVAFAVGTTLQHGMITLLGGRAHLREVAFESAATNVAASPIFQIAAGFGAAAVHHQNRAIFDLVGPGWFIGASAVMCTLVTISWATALGTNIAEDTAEITTGRAFVAVLPGVMIQATTSGYLMWLM